MTLRKTFYFDGGSKPNPGPMELAVVSKGQAYFRDDIGQGDNNEAEWLALLFAVELAQSEGAREVLFVGDSALVVRQASGDWPCRSAQLRPYYEAFQKVVARFAKVQIKHVSRTKNLAGIALARRGLP